MTWRARTFTAGLALMLLIAVICTLDGADHTPLSPRGAALALTAVGLLLAAWFLRSFVWTPLPTHGRPKDDALTDIYAFAYTFTLLAIAVLAIPLGNLLGHGSFPDAGPIRLLRGCIVPPAAHGASEPTAVEAVRPDWPNGLPLCSGAPADVHTVLVSIGGVVATAVADKDEATIYQVRDGFVVPLSTAVLAVIGAAVNLMRRVPEYQKRTHADFAGTPKETPLQPYEAREFVVFQILQLIAAPFIAMVAFYAIAPHSLPASVALAFVSGFFSEGVLLRIRALVEGPEKTPTEAAAQALGALEIGVTRNGVPVRDAAVTVLQLPSGRAVRVAATDVTGTVSLQAVPLGRLRIQVVGPAPAGGNAAPAEIDLASGQRQRLDLAL